MKIEAWQGFEKMVRPGPSGIEHSLSVATSVVMQQDSPILGYLYRQACMTIIVARALRAPLPFTR